MVVRWISCAVLLASALGVQACEGDSTFHVGGAVRSPAGPVEGAEVSLDEGGTELVTTDEDGRFAIDGVSAGAHTLDVSKRVASGSFSGVAYAIHVVEDIELDEVALSEPIALAEPTPDEYGTSMILTWDESSDEDFREYKVYTGRDDALDEDSGELIAVETDRSVSTFSHRPLVPDSTYHYRVFVLNALGGLGGSNVASALAPDVPLVREGDFESEAALEHWSLIEGISAPTIVEDVVHAGEGALLLTVDPDEPCFAGVDLVEATYPIYLVEGATYELSAWMKAAGTLGDPSVPHIEVWNGDDGAGAFPSPNGGTCDDPYDVEWQRVSKEFVASGEKPYLLRIRATVTQLWVDDMALVRVSP